MPGDINQPIKRGRAAAILLLATLLWSSYTQRYLKPDGRIMDQNRNGATTSEAQSYALFFSLVADDRKNFQKILEWTEGHLAAGNISNTLPAWYWGKNNLGQWGVLDTNSAADADLWIAYSLLEAGRLWGRSDYKTKGADILRLITQKEVATLPRLGPMLLPSEDGFRNMLFRIVSNWQG